MYFVYVLQSDVTGWYYIGCTNNIARRLSEHNDGQNVSTKNGKPWKIIYSESFSTNIEARRRERKIKSYKSGLAFKKMLGVG